MQYREARDRRCTSGDGRRKINDEGARGTGTGRREGVWRQSRVFWETVEKGCWVGVPLMLFGGKMTAGWRARMQPMKEPALYSRIASSHGGRTKERLEDDASMRTGGETDLARQG